MALTPTGPFVQPHLFSDGHCSGHPNFNLPFGNDFLRRFFGSPSPFPQRRSPAPREFKVPQRGMGSGILLDRKGYILTNHHVVSDVNEIKVQLADGRQFAAELVGTDPKTDVSVIRIKGRVPENLPFATLGDSDALRPGDIVIAIGAPFGLEQTVTQGIISATGRSGVGIEDYEDFLQTDAPINPGNSGGPLVNMRGDVIGMNTAIATGIGQFAGVGFSIPSSMIQTLSPRLMKGEAVVRGQLGVMIQNVTPELAEHFDLSEARGVLVAQVVHDSSADKAGLHEGDVLVRYDGHEVQDVRHLRKLVAATAPGTKVTLDILRRNKEETLTAVVEKQEVEPVRAPADEADEDIQAKLGLSVQTLTPDVAQQLGVAARNGAVVTQVEEGSPAALDGLQPRDVIVEANRQPVANAADLEQALARAGARDSVLLLVRREQGSLFIVLRMR